FTAKNAHEQIAERDRAQQVGDRSDNEVKKDHELLAVILSSDQTVPAWCISIRLFAAGYGTKRIHAQSLYRTSVCPRAAPATRATDANWCVPASSVDDMASLHGRCPGQQAPRQSQTPDGTAPHYHPRLPRRRAGPSGSEKNRRLQISLQMTQLSPSLEQLSFLPDGHH